MDESGPASLRTGPRLLPAFSGMAASQVVGTTAGLVFWVLAARSAATADVGVAGACVAAVGLVSKVTSLGVGSLWLAELPSLTEPAAGRLVRAGTVAMVLASLLAGGLWWIGVLVVSPPNRSALGASVGTPALGGLFVAVLAATTVVAAWDLGAVAMDQSGAQVTRNLVASVGRLVALSAWVLLLGEPSAVVILVTWLVPMILSGVVFAARTGLLERHAVAPGSEPNRGTSNNGQYRQPDVVRTYTRRALGHHAIDLSLSLGPLLVPLSAAALLGPRDNGFFSVAWMCVGVVFTAPFVLATALFASSAAAGEAAFLRSSRRALPAGLALSASGAMGTWLLGGWILGVFGPGYAEESWPIAAVLVLAGAPMVIKDVVLDWLRLTGRLRRAAALALAASLLDVLGAVIGGVIGGDGTGVAVGWVSASAAQLLLGLPVLIPFLRGVRAAASTGAPLR